MNGAMKDAMRGAVAIVTGGGTGIGAAVVRRLAARGVRCVINYASSRDEAEALAAEVEGAIAVQADIAEDAACRALAAAATEAFGRIDFLVNNAGRTKFANHEDLDALSADDFIDIYRLNTIAPFQMIRACAPAMREGGVGAVVNIASVAGVFGNGSSVAYAASKAAVIQMSKVMAVQHASSGIRVNTVVPGQLHTPMVEVRLAKQRAGGNVEALLEQRLKRIPIGFMGDGRDTASAALFLASDEARFITGTEIVVDGGMTARCD